MPIRSLLFALGVLLAPGPLVARTDAPPARLSAASFPATGVATAVLSVTSPDRYAVEVKSEQGAALHLVDRTLGPRPPAGAAGKEDGRVDRILDAGDYLVVATPAQKAKGKLGLAVHPFREVNAGAPVLVEHATVSATLADFQKVSYWLEVRGEKRTVYLEAQGRALRDLRLWHQGTVLVPAAPAVTEVAGSRPEGNLQLVAALAPGWYRVTAYGGPPRRWARDASEHPFRMRHGLRELDAVARVAERVSSFGVDRYLVPKDADRFFLRLPEPKEFRLDLKSFAIGDALAPADRAGSISAKSKEPDCRLRHRSGKAWTLVSVTGAPGEPYTLQAFGDSGIRTDWERHGPHWISTIGVATGADEIDLTGIVTASRLKPRFATVLAADAIDVGKGSPWARRFNLMETRELYFRAGDAGDYTVRVSGTEANVRFEPFQIHAPPDYEPPELRGTGSRWGLEKGYAKLTLVPLRQGIATVEVAFGDEPAGAPRSVHGNVQLPLVELARDATSTLYLNSRRDDTAVIVRPLPLDLAQALPVTLRPEQPVQAEFRCGGPGKVLLTSPAGADVDAKVDGVSFDDSRDVVKGVHTLELMNRGAEPREVSVRFVPERRPPAAVTAHEEYEEITPDEPRFFDLEQGGELTVELKVDAPAIYRMETTGLLRTAITVRTRVEPQLWRDEEGGEGRNARLIQYLKAGEYLVTVRALGKSAGHAGLAVTKTPVVDGGALAPGRAMHARVAAGFAIQYRLPVAKAGTFRIATGGLGKKYRCRLEGADGWPLVPTGCDAELELALAPGEYTYTTLPQDVEGLRATRLEEVLPARSVSGRGPHALAIGERIENVWQEPEDGEAQRRDVYAVTIPARVDASIVLGEESMQAHVLRRAGAAFEPVAVVPPRKGFKGALEAGEYRVEVECSRPDDGVEYAVKLDVTQLVVGLTKEAAVPSSLAVTVASTGVVEIESHGEVDVRARLVRDDTGAVVDASDDTDRDWNFRIARTLDPGTYTLKLEGRGDEGSTRVSMSAPEERVHAPVTLPFERWKFDLGGKIVIFPFEVPSAGLLVASSGGLSEVGCALEKITGSGARVLAQETGTVPVFRVWAPGPGRYRLRVWSADHEDERVHVSIWHAVPAERPQGGLRMDGTGTARVAIDRPGLFRMVPLDGFAYATAADVPMAGPETDLIALPAGTATVGWAADASTKLALERVSLEPGATAALDLTAGPPRAIDTAVPRDADAVLLVDADAGAPACAFAAGNPVLSRGYEQLERGCAAAGLAGAGSAFVWNPVAARTKLKLVTFPRGGRSIELAAGRASGTLAAGGHARIPLPPGAKRVELALERGLVAFAWEADAVTDFASAIGRGRGARFDTVARHLVVADPAGRGGAWDVRVASAPAPEPPVLQRGSVFERMLAEPATIRVELDPSLAEFPDAVLFAAGADVTCQLTDATGAVQTGARIELRGRAAYATLTAGPGLVKAWVADADRELDVRWGAADGPPPEALAGDAVVPLYGMLRCLSVDVARPSALRVATERPVVMALVDPGGDISAVVEGSRLDRCLGPGRWTVRVRGPVGAALSGRADVALTELAELREGAGPECLILGGGTRTFAFRVPSRRAIGVGLKTTRESLECTLWTEGETFVRSGLQQFGTLDGGTYLLRVRALPGEPVRFTPVVFGLEPPGLGPPEEGLREFLNGLGVTGEGN